VESALPRARRWQPLRLPCIASLTDRRRHHKFSSAHTLHSAVRTRATDATDRCRGSVTSRKVQKSTREVKTQYIHFLTYQFRRKIAEYHKESTSQHLVTRIALETSRDLLSLTLGGQRIRVFIGVSHFFTMTEIDPPSLASNWTTPYIITNRSGGAFVLSLCIANKATSTD
jgi:hypothetical protein